LGFALTEVAPTIHQPTDASGDGIDSYNSLLFEADLIENFFSGVSVCCVDVNVTACELACSVSLDGLASKCEVRNKLNPDQISLAIFW